MGFLGKINPEMTLKQLICIFVISIVWTNAIDVGNLQITIGSRNVSIKFPDHPSLGSAFFYMKLGKDSSLGYAFSKNNASYDLEFKQVLGKELQYYEKIRIIGIFDNNGTVLEKVYDFEIDKEAAVDQDSFQYVLLPSSEESGIHVNSGGKLIFEEHFDTHDSMLKFRKEVRSRLRTPNQEFVAFVDNDKTCSIQNGLLNLTADWVYNTYQVFYVAGKCTAKKSISTQCGPSWRNPMWPIPPVYSAFLRSNLKFRYGRVDINASLPEGDYLFPYLILQSKDTEDDYADHLRIAFPRGNQKFSYSIDNQTWENTIYGGAFIYDDTSLTPYVVGVSFSSSKKLSDSFHTYSIIWRKEIIIFLVDNISYGWITNKNILEKFDRELFLGLGLTVGGISNFPNDKIVGQRKSVYKFIESHGRIDNPWPKPSLLIDYVKVFSESH